MRVLQDPTSSTTAQCDGRGRGGTSGRNCRRHKTARWQCCRFLNCAGRLHFASKAGRIDLGQFRGCWSDFLVEIEARTDNYGPFFHVVQPDSADREIVQWIGRHC